MKVSDLIVRENYLPSNRNQTERRNNEWFSFGSILLYYYFPCYMSLEINQSMQGPNGHYDKDYRVGQLPSLLGNMQIYNFPLTAQAKLIACRLLYWLTFQSCWKVESFTRNRIFESTKQQKEENFCKTQHILFPP